MSLASVSFANGENLSSICRVPVHKEIKSETLVTHQPPRGFRGEFDHGMRNHCEVTTGYHLAGDEYESYCKVLFTFRDPRPYDII